MLLWYSFSSRPKSRFLFRLTFICFWSNFFMRRFHCFASSWMQKTDSFISSQFIGWSSSFCWHCFKRAEESIFKPIWVVMKKYFVLFGISGDRLRNKLWSSHDTVCDYFVERFCVVVERKEMKSSPKYYDEGLHLTEIEWFIFTTKREIIFPSFCFNFFSHSFFSCVSLSLSFLQNRKMFFFVSFFLLFTSSKSPKGHS